MSKRKTKEEWQILSDIKYNNEFEIIEEPLNSHTKVNILHKKCNNIILMALNNHLNRYCKYCSNKNKKTQEEWQNLSNKIHNFEYLLLEEPKNGKQNINVLHKKCNNILSINMNNHINGENKCNLCNKYGEKNNSYWNDKNIEIYGDEYTILEEIITGNQKVKIKHNKCGSILKKSMTEFLTSKRGCRNCNENTALTDINYWQNILDVNHGINEYELLDSPKNLLSKINIKHNKCDNIYKSKSSLIKKGCGCNICYQSKGNLKVLNYLNSNSKIKIK